MSAGFPMEDPWGRSFWRHNLLDQRAQAAQCTLLKRETHEDKLADAVLRGRIYGLGQMHDQAIRRQKLGAVLQREALADKPW